MESDNDMVAALKADGDLLREMTGEDHGPYFPRQLLDEASFWMRAIVSPDDIEQERQEKEAHYGCLLAVYEKTHPSLFGTVCTKIEWEIL
jgi:hypothetical protein